MMERLHDSRAPRGVDLRRHPSRLAEETRFGAPPIGRVRAAVGLALVLAVFLGAPAEATAQSALERPPSLSGAWVGKSGVAHFHFIHRFTVVGDIKKVINSPSLLLAAGLPHRTLVGVVYASSSDVSPEVRPNEWELFARWQPVGAEPTSPLRLTVQAGYNTAVASVDGEVAVGGEVGRVALFGVARVLGDAYGRDRTRAALGAGTRVRLGRWVAVGGDVATLADRGANERIAWSAGLLLGIPYSPHSFSLHATNIGSNTLQGASRGGQETRWGFEFTVPFTPSRYFGGPGDVAAAASPPPAPASSPTAVPGSSPPPASASADTVYAAIDGLEYSPARIEVAPGTTIVWTNRAPLAHTVTADDGKWGSPLIDPDGKWSYTFAEPGTYPFHCAPHPFMKGMVVVREGVVGAGDAGAR